MQTRTIMAGAAILGVGALAVGQLGIQSQDRQYKKTLQYMREFSPLKVVSRLFGTPFHLSAVRDCDDRLTRNADDGRERVQQRMDSMKNTVSDSVQGKK
jgi:hypothetical protein